MKKLLLTGIVLLLFANVSWAQHSHGAPQGKEGSSAGMMPQMMAMCPMMKMMEQHMKMKDSTPQLLELAGILEKILRGVSAEEKERLLQDLARIRQQLEKPALGKTEAGGTGPAGPSFPKVDGHKHQ